MKTVMKSKKVMSTIAVVVLAVALFASGVVASPPMFGDDPPVASKINYQGQLTDSAGNPLNGTYDMEFLFYDAATGGSQVGSTITKNNVEVTSGLFRVDLDVDQSDLDGQALWLEVIVEGETLSPRQEILPVPYALSLKPGAEIAGTLSGPVLWAGNDGVAVTSVGLWGYSVNAAGVYGESANGIGLSGVGHDDSIGTQGWNTGSGVGVKGYSASGDAGYFDGDVHITDGLQVDGPATGFFPRPAYDSGWVSFSQGEIKTLTHGLGGNVDKYVVDLEFKNTSFGVNQIYYGGIEFGGSKGAYWYRLTSTTIMAKRREADTYADQIRIRIWVYK